MTSATDSLTFSIDVYRGEVMVVLNRPVQWFSLTPEQAKKVAEILVEKAQSVPTG